VKRRFKKIQRILVNEKELILRHLEKTAMAGRLDEEVIDS